MGTESTRNLADVATKKQVTGEEIISLISIFLCISLPISHLSSSLSLLHLSFHFLLSLSILSPSSLLLPLSSFSLFTVAPLHHSFLSAFSPSGSPHLSFLFFSPQFSLPFSSSLLCPLLSPSSTFPLCPGPHEGSSLLCPIGLDALLHHKLGMVTSETTTHHFTLTTNTSMGLGMNMAGSGCPHK